MYNFIFLQILETLSLEKSMISSFIDPNGRSSKTMLVHRLYLMVYQSFKLLQDELMKGRCVVCVISCYVVDIQALRVKQDFSVSCLCGLFRVILLTRYRQLFVLYTPPNGLTLNRWYLK